MFSSRLGHTGGRNRLAIALDERKAAGLPIADLTLSNPTVAGFAYPPDLLHPLADSRALCYQPQPFGLEEARRAVSEDFGRRGLVVPPHRIVLTASTSEAYSLLFKLLCDPGDTVLAPRPSYPLVDHLTALDGISLEHYSLEFHGLWSIDLDGLRVRLSRRERPVRAIIMVSPNNPTGSVVKIDEILAIASLSREHEAALIADEVFADYPIDIAAVPGVLAQQEALTFALGGLSKSIGLPQAKLGWIAVGGPPQLAREALDRLETICDAYLSVSTPVQVAAPELLKRGARTRTQILTRVRHNRAVLASTAASHPACTVLPVEAGWYAIVQVPAVQSEESLVLELLNGAGILVHPGYFFDFEREAYLVLSLLPEPDLFASALHTLFGEIGRIR